MGYEDIKKQLAKGETSFKLTNEEVDELLKKSYTEGMHEEKRWHEGTGSGGVPKVDPFYSDPVYESGFAALPYSFNGKKKLRAGAKKKVSESMYGLRSARSGEISGRGNKYITQEELFLIQDAAYLRAQTDPLGTSIVENFVNFVIGRSVKVDCFVPEIEAQLLAFRKQNDMDTKEVDMVKHSFINGEFFLKIKVNKDRIRVYGVTPQNVIDMIPNEDDFGDIIGYKTVPAQAWNVDSTKFYFDTAKTKWIKDFNYYLEEFPETEVDADFKEEDVWMQFIKVGNYDEVRGRSPFQPVLRYLRYAEDFTIDRLRLNHERSKVIMVKTVMGGESTQQNPYAAPRGGIVLIATSNVTYKFLDSHIDADDAKEDGMWILHHIGAGVVMPIHILQQRADQGNYASIKKMDSPFTQNILKWQDFFGRNWLRLDNFVIKHAVDNKKLKKSYKVPAFVGLNSGTSTEAIEFFAELNPIMIDMVINKEPNEKIIKEAVSRIKKEKLHKNVKVDAVDVPITRIFPDTVKDNPLEIAKVLFLHQKMGLVSMASASLKAGYDWRVELNQQLYEKTLGIVRPGDEKGVSSEPGRAGAGDDIDSGEIAGSNINI